jgi:hypothetical protein
VAVAEVVYISTECVDWEANQFHHPAWYWPSELDTYGKRIVDKAVVTNQVTLGDLLAKQFNILSTIASSLPYSGTY